MPLAESGQAVADGSDKLDKPSIPKMKKVSKAVREQQKAVWDMLKNRGSELGGEHCVVGGLDVCSD